MKQPSHIDKHEAADLQTQFAKGDTLAPIECARHWHREGLDPATLPAWVSAFFMSASAEYYERGPRRSRKARKPVKWSELERMSAAKRKRVMPDFDRIAKLNSGWTWRAKFLRKPHVQAYLDKLKKIHNETGGQVYIWSDGTIERTGLPERPRDITRRAVFKGDQFMTGALDVIAKSFNIPNGRTIREHYDLSHKIG